MSIRQPGAESRVVGVPVAQAQSWEEGYLGQVKADVLKPYENLVAQKQIFLSWPMTGIILRAGQVPRRLGVMPGMSPMQAAV
ncbi:hypothetical protein ACFSQ7_36090 [Paenibacillus rhizoplanae]